MLHASGQECLGYDCAYLSPTIDINAEPADFGCSSTSESANVKGRRPLTNRKFGAFQASTGWTRQNSVQYALRDAEPSALTPRSHGYVVFDEFEVENSNKLSGAG
jgi:hypothetical protein